MKKITLLFCLFFIGYGYSQVVLSEDFEGSLNTPPGWIIEDLAIPPNGEVWTLETGGEAGGFTPGNTLVYDSGASGNYATFDSDGYGNNGTAEESTLTSPVFDASGLTSVTLEFNTVYNGNFGGQGFVEVYDGTSWVTVNAYATEAGGAPSTTLVGQESFDVPELVGVSNAQVRFRFVGNWSISWSVDNIEVFQCTVAAPGNDLMATTPADGATNVDIIYGESDSVGSFEWTDPTTGGPVTNYDISIGTNAAADDIGTLEGFPSGNIILFGFQPDTTYFWKITSTNCAGETESPIFSFTTAACAETSAPAAATTPFPADGEIDVPIDGNANNSIIFTFNSPATANTVLLFGTANPPTQTFNDFNSGETFGNLMPNTQYFWSIDTHNCIGVTAGQVWSFTTGAVLSTQEVEDINFEYYVDSRNVLNLSGQQTFEDIIVHNLLGQQVLSKNLSGQNETVDLKALTSGVYLATVQINGTAETFKILKK